MSEAKSLYVVLTANSTQYKQILDEAARDMRRFGDDVDRTSDRLDAGGWAVDRYSRRLRLALQATAALGPALIPLGGVAAAALGGLAGLFGAGTAGALGLLVATQGVGDALEAVEKARLDPTVANLQAAEKSMSRIAPEAQEWVKQFQALRPIFGEIRDAGAAELFPGLSEALDSAERLAPVMKGLVVASSRAGGDAIGDSAASLTTERWAPFLAFLEDEIPDAIRDVTTLVGSLGHAGSELWMSFAPSNDRFVDWLLDVGAGFDRWASSPQGRDDVEAFLDYVQENGPEVEEFFVAVVDMLAEIVRAAAPLGGPVLTILTAFAKAIGSVADSDLGTPILAGVAALSLYNRTMAVTIALQSKLALGGGGTGKPGSPTALAAGGSGGMLALAAMVGGGYQVQNFQKTKDGEQGLLDGLLRGAVPAFGAMGMMGIDLPTMGGMSDGGGRNGVELALGLRDSKKQAEGLRDVETAELGLSEATIKRAKNMGISSAALAEANERAAATAGTFVGLGASLDDGEVSLTDWIAEMRRGADALIAFQGNAEKAAKRGLDEGLIDSLEAAGEAGAMRMKQLANATDEEIARANRAYRRGERAIEKYREYVRDIPEARLRVDDSAIAAAGRRVAGLKALMAELGGGYNPRSSTPEDGGGLAGLLGSTDSNANGGIYDGSFRTFADGGFGSDGWHARESQIVAGGANILWGEPETGWEAYISGKPSQRNRNRAIWADAGRRLGYEPERRGSEHVTGGSVVRHTFEHRVVVTGELDTRKAVTQIRQQMHDTAVALNASAAESDANRGRMSWK